MRMEEAFYNISMYMYDRYVLEYAQIIQIGTKSMIRDIEGLSKDYRSFWLQFELHDNISRENMETILLCWTFTDYSHIFWILRVPFFPSPFPMQIEKVSNQTRWSSLDFTIIHIRGRP